ncbi:synaptojanin-1 [Diaphorina citri]|uniref:Phosphatidylinositol-3-phosphatase SAC1 n=1 Tax=Diaphorina citri TaxID=121845 RepID=A0A3Q0J620_DIACI|nr:synaptojanin-1 [Diaphorina citri]
MCGSIEIRTAYVRHRQARAVIISRLSCERETTVLYLVMVTGCVSVGKIHESEIFRVTSTAFISLRNQAQDEERISEVRKLLNSGTFYFSWSSGAADSLDLTLCAQRRKYTSETDRRFFWNRMLHIHLLRFSIDPSPWLLKIMCGSIEIRTVYVGHRQARAVIISRLSCERAGTRFNVRGVNDDGHVANFVETEQVLFLDDEVTSYVQTRGSVPLFWEQPGIQVGSHKVRMSRGVESSSAAFNRHMGFIKERYGHQVIVNLLGTSLIGSKEGEATLSNLFQSHHAKSSHSSDVPHIVYDYHQECRGGNTKNISKLLAKVEKYLQAFGLFYAKGANVSSEQIGTLRTNCLDCLDRTNCVQTVFGLQLIKLKHIIQQIVFKQLLKFVLIHIYSIVEIATPEHIIISSAHWLALSELAATILLALRSTISSKPMANISTGVSKSSGELVSTRVLCLAVRGESKRNSYLLSHCFPQLSLSDWLLDSPRTAKHKTLVDTSSPEDLDTPVDIFAIGFEEIVDLNASNIVAASSDNANQWAEELQKVLSRDHEYVLVTHVQLVGVCLFLFTRPHLAPHLRDVATDSVKTGKVVEDVGPMDATVIVQLVNPPSDDEEPFDSDFMAALLGDLSQIGEVILVRFVEDTMWVTFRDGLHALSAVKKGITQICGHQIRLSLKTPDWLSQFRQEIALCSNNTIPLVDPLPRLVFTEGGLSAPTPDGPSGRSSPSGPPSRPPLPNIPHKPKAGVVSLGSVLKPGPVQPANVSPGDAYEEPIGSVLKPGPVQPANVSPGDAYEEPIVWLKFQMSSAPPSLPPFSSPPSLPPPPAPSEYEICAGSAIYEEISDDQSTPAPLGPPPPLPPMGRQAPPLPSRQGAPPVPSRPGIPPPIPSRNTPPVTPKKTAHPS